jgi:hypothetical protein
MKPYLLLAIALGLLAPSSAQARSINWGSAVFDSLYYSGGATLDENMIFEVGSFGSFVPTEANMDLWSANWKVFDQATVANERWNVADAFVSSSANVTASGQSNTAASLGLPPNVFAPGELGYIWAYSGNQTYQAGLEWALVTNTSSDGNSVDDWLFPVHSDQQSLPLEWRLSTASSVVFGGLNDVDGAGVYSEAGSYQLQTHTIAAVPEPSASLLTSIAGLLLASRRRRSARSSAVSA